MYHVTISDYDKEKISSLCLDPVAKAKRLLSIESYLRLKLLLSFLAKLLSYFVGVFTIGFPHKAPALMKYKEMVRNLAARGGNWKFYDRNFCF